MKSRSLPLNNLIAPVVLLGAFVVAPALSADSKRPADIGLDLAGMDRSVKPGDDFFRYANGTWIKETEIPADRGVFGVGAEVADLTNQRTVELIQQAAASNAPSGSTARKIGDFYAAFMDLPTIEKRALQPLQPTFDRIAAIR